MRGVKRGKSLTDNGVAGVYAVAFVVVAAAAVTASAGVMDLFHRGGQGAPGDLEGWLLNLVPSLCVGAAAYLVLARAVLGGDASPHPWRRHLRRSAALYVVALGLGILMLHDGGNPDFWRFGQLVLWPWVAALAGIIADAMAVARTRGDSFP
jgi:hypothetical protein